MMRTWLVSFLICATAVAHAERPRRVADGDALGVVRFAVGSSRVSDAALDDLDEIGRWHADHPDSLLMIEGYASPAGSWNKNLRISQQRTDSVREALVEAGADPARMVLVAHSENQVDDAPPMRRVVIRANRAMVELAREQRDPEIGEDARAARRATSARREVGATGGAEAAPSASGPVAGGNTVIIIPGGAGATMGPGSFDRRPGVVAPGAAR
jgi:hypothetical protein